MRLLVALLAFCCLMVSTHAAETAYTIQITSARLFAAEGSWAKARDAYTAALRLAPDERAREHCTLGIVDSTWRTAPEPSGWDAKQVQHKKDITSYDLLLNVYTEGRPYDGFWVEITESRARCYDQFDSSKGWIDRLAVADFLGDKLPTAATTVQYVRFIERMAELNKVPYDATYRFNTHLEAALRAAPDQETHAHLKLLTALRTRDTSNSKDNRASPFTEAIEIAKGTSYEGPSRVWDFLWRADAGHLPKRSLDNSPDFPAWLVQLDATRAFLPKSPTTPQDLAAAKALEEQRTNWISPVLMLRAPSYATPGEAIFVNYGVSEHTNLTFKLYRHSLETWRSDIKNRETRNRSISSGATLVETWTIPLTKTQDHAWQAGKLQLAPAIQGGIYTLVAEGDGTIQPSSTKQQNIIVSNAGATLVKGEHSEVVAYVYNQTNKEPLANVELSIVWADSKIAAFTVTTDSDGRATLGGLPLVPEGQYWSELLMLIDGNPVAVSLNDYHRNSRSQRPKITADIVLDRPLYRPGDTVNWKLIVRSDDGVRYSVPEKPLKLFVSLNNTPLVKGETISLSSFGTTHGQIVIPLSARPGHAQIELAMDEKTRSHVAGFRVDNIVPPATKADIILTSEPDSFRPGSIARFKVRASYLSGGPIIGAPVQCAITLHHYSSDQNNNPSPKKQRLDDWIKNETKPRSRITDATGCAEFALAIPSDLPHEKIYGALSVDLLPDGGAPVKARNSFTITDTGYAAETSYRERLKWARPNKQTELLFNIVDGFGRECRFEGKAEILELRWVESWLDSNNNVATPTEVTAKRRQNESVLGRELQDWTKLYGRYTEHKIATLSVSSNDKGELPVPFTFSKSGCYAIRIVSGNGPISSETKEPQIIVADESNNSIPVNPELCLLLAEENPTATSSSQFLIIFPDGQTEGVLAVTDQKTTALQRVSLKDRCGVITVPQTTGPSLATAGPHGRSNYDWPKVDFNNSPKTAIRFEILPQSNESKPGETVTVLMSIAPLENPHQRTELSFTTTDEALFRLSGDREQKPKFSRSYPGIATSEDPSRWDRSMSEWYREKLKTAGLLEDPRLSNSFNLFDCSIDQFEGEIRGEASFGMACLDAAPSCADFESFRSSTLQLRRHFSSTACWEPSIITDAKGEARVTFKYPDNLTQWRLSAYAVGEDLNSFGTATAYTRTSLPFQARLQLPRFLVAGDTASASAVLVNRSEADLTVSAKLSVNGAVSADPKSAQREALSVLKQNEAHVAWEVKADQPGTATFTLASRAGAESDAMELPLPVLEDGIEQTTAVSTRLAADAKKCSFTLPLPKPLDPARTHVTVLLNAGYASMLLDALPYLVDYPYGCVEQTTSRFLPAVVVRSFLKSHGLPVDVVDNRIRASESHADATRRAKTAGLSKLDDVITQSLARLVQAQIGPRYGSNGFGWWPGAQQPDLWMTGYVVWSLAQAKAADIAIPEKLLENNSKALAEMLKTSKTTDDSSAFALAAALKSNALPDDAKKTLPSVFDRLYAQRDTLAASGRASLVLAANDLKRSAELAVLLRNLENGATRVKSSDLGDTVHWGSASGYWRAMDGAVESTALTLLALLEADPKHPLIEPTINWLLLNRRSAHWSNTRDTAFALLALTRGLELRGDSSLDAELELLANGSPVQRIKFTRETVLLPSSTITIPVAKLRPGQTTFTLRRLSGNAPIYAVAHSTAWARSDDIHPSGHLIALDRTLTRQKAQPTLIGTLRLTPEPMPTGSSAATGEQVTAVIALNVPNDLEYVMVEVPKPAGCEPLNPLSGWDARIERVDDSPAEKTIPPKPASDTGRPVYREEHDDKSVFFLDRLSAGKWQLRFGLRAVTPGDFRVLPAQVQAMYVPEVCANTDALRVTIKPAE